MGADRPLRKQRGGSASIAWEDETRKKIQAAGIVNRLIDCVNGKIKLEKSQVSAAIGLMRKVLPDLSSSEVTAEIVHRFAQVPAVMPKDQWLATRGDPKLIEHHRALPGDQSDEPKPKDPNSKLN